MRKPKVERKLSAQAEESMRGAVEGTPVPLLNPTTAALYAKLLSIGCPAGKAVRYLCPDLPVEVADITGYQWLADIQVKKELDGLYGGAFIDLPKEKRFELVLEKMMAEAAFFCWTTNWADANTKDELDKLKQARDMLQVALGRKVDETDPMQAFAKFALEMARNLESGRKAKAPKALPQSQEPDMLDAVSGVFDPAKRAQ